MVTAHQSVGAPASFLETFSPWARTSFDSGTRISTRAL